MFHYPYITPNPLIVAPNKESKTLHQAKNKNRKMVRQGKMMMKVVKQLENLQPSPAESMAKGQVLHQTTKGPPKTPVRMMLGGVVVVATLAYFTLYAHKKHDATLVDVVKVTPNK
ncbi:unnamed protein product [Lactuca virosa]|uniref:Transmembrane protein n=1 Tax=Lactuca virosa TaxID=75947 RepID=A0AAU9MXE4_9ASTR|nr:unnamed protein product [Lactuca virosa]